MHWSGCRNRVVVIDGLSKPARFSSYRDDLIDETSFAAMQLVYTQSNPIGGRLARDSLTGAQMKSIWLGPKGYP